MPCRALLREDRRLFAADFAGRFIFAKALKAAWRTNPSEAALVDAKRRTEDAPAFEKLAETSPILAPPLDVVCKEISLFPFASSKAM